MDWEEQLKKITFGTLFKFFGKSMVASLLWMIILYIVLFVVIMLPMIAIMSALGFE